MDEGNEMTGVNLKEGSSNIAVGAGACLLQALYGYQEQEECSESPRVTAHTVVAVVAFEIEGGYTCGAATTCPTYALVSRDVKKGFVSETPYCAMSAGSAAIPSPQFIAIPF